MNEKLKDLVDIIYHNKIELKFNILEIGALQVEKSKEPFYELLRYFPFSKIIGFEVDKAVCDKMNLTAKSGIKYYPYALGRNNEKKNFYITNHPMCCSLYKPNDSFNSLYNNLEVAYLKHEMEVETISLDFFVEENQIGEIDLLKIDVQGAELDIFKGGVKALKDVLQIVCEVEFVHHYENQPLFGDVSNFLSQYDFMFNKFLSIAGRSLRPILLEKNPNTMSQQLWADAVFIHHVQKIKNLNNEKLLKLSLIACVYGSVDLTFFCLSHYDQRNSSSFSNDWMNKISK